MTQYANKRFSVSQSGRDPKDCGHGWIRPNGECQFCGLSVASGILDATDWLQSRQPPPTPPDP